MLKSWINSALRNAGYQIRRVPKRAVGLKRGSALRFGPYTIHTDNESTYNAYADPEANQVITRLVAALTREGKVAMIDVGANCGDTAAMARMGGPAAILCVEGDPSLCASLRANMAQFKDVEVRQVFLGEAPETIFVAMEKAGFNNTLATRGDGGKQPVVLDTLDHLVEDWPPVADLRLIKCDAEGFDIRILFGGRKTLAVRRPILLFEYNRDSMEQTEEPGFRIFPFLKELDYNRMLVYDNIGRFVCAAELKELDFIRDLHDYADGKHGKIDYYDFVIFNHADNVFAQGFLESERRNRLAMD
jgi:FkbM family methyltransferase